MPRTACAEHHACEVACVKLPMLVKACLWSAHTSQGLIAMTLQLFLQTFRHEILTDGVGFDNIAAAMVSVIQILTYAAWSYMMYRTTDTYSLVAVIYFISCIVLGCYFVVSTSILRIMPGPKTCPHALVSACLALLLPSVNLPHPVPRC